MNRRSIVLLPVLFAVTGAVNAENPSNAASGQTGPSIATTVSLNDWQPPSLESLPNDKYGEMVRYGHELMVHTPTHIGPEVKDKSMRYAGNNLSCTTCHQNAGMKAYSSPLIGVTASFPQYRARENAFSSVEERINGCMERSMNGRPLPANSREMKAFLTYFHFLSKGIPVGATLEGRGTPAVNPPNRRANLAEGEAVYRAHCVACHGEDGAGKRVGIKGDAKGYLFPPLWGPDSFNSGASTAQLLVAMKFIKHNMPQGVDYRTPLLTDDQAYDVAGYIVSKPRPEKSGLEKDYPARWNKPVDAAFPPYMEGVTADQHKYGPFPPLLEKARKLAEEQKAREALAKN